MHNSGHIRGVTSAGYTLHENMAAYDKLPKEIRKALQESSTNWSAASVLRERRKHGAKNVPISFVVQRIKDKDRELAELNPPRL